METWKEENEISTLVDEGPPGVLDENGGLESWEKFHGHRGNQDGTWSYPFPIQ